MSSQYRELMLLSGNVQERDKISATLNGQGNLSILNRQGKVLLYVGHVDDGQLAIARQRQDGDWETLGKFSPRKSTSVVIEFLLPRSKIIVQGAAFEADLALNEIKKIAGIGDWYVNSIYDGIDDAKSDVIYDQVALATRHLSQSHGIVFDIGMHNGNDTDYYLAKGYSVVSVDANPLMCWMAARRFKKEIESNRLVIANLGIGPQSGHLKFFINKDISEWSSFDREIASRGHDVEEIDVDVVAPGLLLESFGVPHYAKIDIEGLDDVAVEALIRNSIKPKYISFENGTLSVFERLVTAGYCRFKLVNQSKVENQSGKELSGEGMPITYEFQFGSSGPFGKDLGEDWLNAEDMREMLCIHHQTFTDAHGDWFDLHASLD